MRRLTLTLSIGSIFAVSCGSSSSDSPTDTGGVTSDSALDGKVEDAADAGSGCGSAPYATYTSQVQLLGPTGLNPAPGAKLTSPLCPGMTFTSLADGKITILVQRGVPVDGELNLVGAVPTTLAEAVFTGDFSPPGISVYSVDFAAYMPNLATKSYLQAGTDVSAGTGACAKDDGVTFSIPEDPAAVIDYYDGTKKVPGATATALNGNAIIELSVVDTFVTLKATKAGCTFATPSPLTGRVRSLKGHVAIVNQNVK
jgi:hypothetical protein